MEGSNKVKWQALSSVRWLILFGGVLLFGLFSPGQPVKADNNVSWQEDQIVVDYSIDEVKTLVTSCWKYDKLFKYVTKAQKLSSNECYIEATVLKGTVTFWMKVKIMPEVVDADGRTVRIEARMSDGNVKTFSAKGKLVALDKRKTLVVFRMKADPNLPLPDSMIEAEIKKMLHNALVNLNVELLLK